MHAPRRGPASHDLTPEEKVRGGSSRSESKRRASAENGRVHLDRFRQTEAGKAATHRGGTNATKQRWKCDDCGFVSHAPGVAIHQRSKDHHGGRTRIDNLKETQE